MFWRFGGYANISTLDTILDKPDVTVEELLDESDLIQELKQQNSKLIEFLRDEPVLKKLLNYVVADYPPEDTADKGKGKEKEDEGKGEEKEEQQRTTGISFFGGKGKGRSRSKSVSKKDSAGDGETEAEKKEAQRKKYAYVACEVLSSEVWSLTEAVMEQRDHLRQFWQYMQRPAPLDPLQAGYFTKANEALLDKKTEDMLSFFKSLDGIVPAMLQHVDCPMIMDLLLKIISLEKHEGGAGIVDWLQAQDLIPLLLGYLSSNHSSATQTSAGDFLKAIITISANATTQDQSVIGPNELTRQLVSDSCIQTLITDMLQGGNPLTVGVGIIIEVIRKNNSDYDLDNQVGPEPKTTDPIYLGTALRQFANHVPEFMHLVRSPSAKKPDLKAAFGRKIEPLGFDRFKTCELMAELLHCSNMGLLNERGAEEDVRKRDAERERLKADGRLATPKAPNSPENNSHEEFGSSVDSHGFHHAERPSDEDMNDEKPEEIRKQDVQGAGIDEDGFEKVNKPNADADDLPDEVSFDDLNEKPEYAALAKLQRATKNDPASPSNSPNASTADIPKPLSPTKAQSSTESAALQHLRSASMQHFDPPPTHAADSPTTAGVTDRIDRLDVDEDTVMTEFGEEPSMNDSDEDQQTELERELANLEDKADKPAPLFARKDPPPPIQIGDESQRDEQEQDIDDSIATIQGESENGERKPYETEEDGKPVVGDLLKMKFVEWQVVPTILDFFFRFPWNNFLHNVVYDVVQQVFNGTLDRGYNRTVAFDLFTAAGPSDKALGLVSTKDITTRILDGQRASDTAQQHKGMRLGYMGHLTLIAEEVCKFGNRHPPENLDPAVLDRVGREEWVEYVEGTLAETRDKDNAVLGGVRPQEAMGVGRPGGFNTSNNNNSNNNNNNSNSSAASALASAGIGGGSNITPQDSLAMSEGTVGRSFEIHGGSDAGMTMLEDEEMELEAEQMEERQQQATAMAQGLEDDEQNSPEPNRSGIPPPLNVPPSRARRQLAARLAKKKAEAAENAADPDAADSAALEIASTLPESPPDTDVASLMEREVPQQGSPDPGLEVVGLRTLSGASRFSGLFTSSSDSSSGDEGDLGSDGDDAERHTTPNRSGPKAEAAHGEGTPSRKDNRRRPSSTTEAKSRTPLDDEDEDAEDLGPAISAKLVLGGEGPFADPLSMHDDSSEEEELVEIRTRRTS
ncbi:sporulation-induced protein [Vermiconidia calcicola]|uniref:Sporulation-induced protein n=1 Tax=Vermiconidia calcicola TaxID=1690605 RepID=A0ACC3N0F7_9PEZI|nr:sporulation-induced protein [Vermiconidia calcicola]